MIVYVHNLGEKACGMVGLMARVQPMVGHYRAFGRSADYFLPAGDHPLPGTVMKCGYCGRNATLHRFTAQEIAGELPGPRPRPSFPPFPESMLERMKEGRLSLLYDWAKDIQDGCGSYSVGVDFARSDSADAMAYAIAAMKAQPKPRKRWWWQRVSWSWWDLIPVAAGVLTGLALNHVLP
jgi:hypothetical protein